MEHIERTVSSETVYKGKIITVTKDRAELENGAVVLREVVRHCGGVCVLAFDENGDVLFVRQYRYPYSESLLELPAGKLEQGEAPEACGFRELEEETGYRAAKLFYLGELYPSPGFLDERLYLFRAGDVSRRSQRLDEDEFLSVEKIPYERAVEMCLTGELKDAKTVTALLLYHMTKG